MSERKRGERRWGERMEGNCPGGWRVQWGGQHWEAWAGGGRQAGELEGERGPAEKEEGLIVRGGGGRNIYR